jgi:hypothetical protein
MSAQTRLTLSVTHAACIELVQAAWQAESALAVLCETVWEARLQFGVS